MARPLRIEYPDAWYHVMNRGRKGEAVFKDKKDCLSFIELLREATETWNLRVSAYCLMANHYHLLLQTPEGNLSRCMRHLNGVYTQHFNRAHRADGPLFPGRYKSILLDADSYLLQVVRYVHRNSIRAGITDRLEGYRWSSYRGYLSKAQQWSWLHKDYLLSMLSEKRATRLTRFREFMAMDDEQDLTKIYEGKKWPSILGTERFITAIRERFFSGKGDDEVPQWRELAPDYQRIKRAVCEFYDIGQAQLLHSRRGVFNEPRNVAIYLTRRLRGDSLKGIGREFHITKYSSVSSVIERMEALISTDRGLKEKIEELAELSKSQEQT